MLFILTILALSHLKSREFYLVRFPNIVRFVRIHKKTTEITEGDKFAFDKNQRIIESWEVKILKQAEWTDPLSIKGTKADAHGRNIGFRANVQRIANPLYITSQRNSTDKSYVPNRR